jgi:hypothetical protein
MTRQATLVAFTGSKPGPLAGLIDSIGAQLGAALGSAYRPYAADQVHATLLGLEALPGSPRLNRNFSAARHRSAAMDVSGLVAHVAHELRLPLSIRFGGFAPDDVPFTSRDRSPYERSFSIQADKVVLMGWPVRRRPVASVPWLYPLGLDALRREAQSFGVLHAWHAEPSAVDNDLYLRLGLLGGAAEKIRAVESEIRQWLSARPPVIVDLVPDVLSVVSYTDATLPPLTSRFRPVLPPLTEDEVDALYA